MRKKITTIILAMMLALTTVFGVSADVHYKSGCAAKSGKEVFYAFTSSSNSTAIYKVNINSKKKTKIYPKKSSNLSNFDDINVKGGYIYCSCIYKDVLSKTAHICRISIKNGKVKRLASGINPTIVGDKIIYDQTKAIRVEETQVNFQSVPTGKMKEMDLDGKNKKDIDVTLADTEATFVNSGKQVILVKGKSKYQITGKGKKLTKTTGSKKKVVFKTKAKIINYRVLSGYIVIKTIKGNSVTAYGVKTNGKKKVKLISWKTK